MAFLAAVLATAAATAEPASVRTVASYTPPTPLPVVLHLSALASDGQPAPYLDYRQESPPGIELPPNDVSAVVAAVEAEKAAVAAAEARAASVQVRAAADTAVRALPPSRPSSEPCGPFIHGEAVSRWYDLVASYGDWDVCTGLWIIDRESGGDPGVYNYQGSGACGLWQTLPCDRGTDPVANTELAHLKWLASGWSPWQVYTG